MRTLILVIPIVVMAGPLLVALFLGIRQIWGLPFVLACSACFLAGAALLKLLSRRMLPPIEAPPPDWAPDQEAAWAKVVAPRLEAARAGEPPLQVAKLYESGRSLLKEIARYYHPTSREPLLEASPVHLAGVLEATMADIVGYLKQVPLLHEARIEDLRATWQAGKLASKFYNVANLLGAIYDPTRLLTSRTGSVALRFMRSTMEKWLVEVAFDRLSVHAIELYSGRMVIERPSSPAAITALSEAGARELIASDKLQATIGKEPLRILVIGQAKAGKSSLANALFGEQWAAVDVLPTTAAITRYTFSLPELEGPPLLLYDTGGYGQALGSAGFVAQVMGQAKESDVILLVVKATSPARDEDRQVLEELRRFYDAAPRLRRPPVVIVLSHIDGLKPPLEWEPPYAIDPPVRPKEQSIANACRCVLEEFAGLASGITWVCTGQGRLFNVDEGLVPLLLSVIEQEGKRVQLLRMKERLLDEERVGLLKGQVAATGRFLIQAGGRLAREGIRWLGDLNEKIEKR